MKCVKIYLIFLLSTLVGASTAHAQSPDVTKAFTTYKSKYPATRLHLIFNQPSYAAGDTIYFSAWHLDGGQRLVPGRYIASADLMGENGKAIIQINFKIEDGRANNQIVLPKDLTAGNYTLLAYTTWMRNFGKDTFFQKRIEVKGRNEISSPAFPMTAGAEGGSLVAGISNHVVVAADYPGTIISIRNQSGEEVASTTADSTGVASFNITPATGAQYTAFGPSNSKAPLPSVKTDGVAVNLSGANVTLTSAGQYKDKELTAVFTSQDKLVDTYRVKFSDGKASITTPSLLRGSFQEFYLIDQSGALVAERVFALKANIDENGKISGPADAPQRQNVTMSLELPSIADVSITAYQQKIFNTNFLKNSFYLSEIPAVLHWAEKHPKYDLSINTFLVTQHWSRTNWTEILSKDPKKLAFPFHNIITETGVVKSKLTGEPVPDSTNVIIYLQKNTMGYDTYTRNGKFEIQMPFDFWGTDYLFVALQRRNRELDPEFGIYFDVDTVNISPTGAGKQLKSESPYGNYSLNKQLIQNSYSYFGKNAKADEGDKNPNAIFEDELGQIDYEVNVEKYVVFPTMEDLLREVIPFVQFRKRGNNQGVRMMMAYPQGNRASKSNPLFVVDGVMTRDVDFFLSLKPKDVAVVKLANNPNRLAQLGKIGENGVVLIESKRGTLGDSLRAATNIAITGLNQPVKFRSTVPASSDTQRVPDLRSTIFWEPRMKTEGSRAELSFATSDDVGPITIIVQGLTSDGVPIFIERQLDVKFRRTP
jgi:hypothetical protein